MLKNFNDRQGDIRIIKKEERDLEGLCIRYSLYEICVPDLKMQYAIGISTEEEDCFASVGADRDAAYLLCEEVIFGGVTPCTLHDIVSDWQKEEYYLH